MLFFFTGKRGKTCSLYKKGKHTTVCSYVVRVLRKWLCYSLDTHHYAIVKDNGGFSKFPAIFRQQPWLENYLTTAHQTEYVIAAELRVSSELLYALLLYYAVV